MKNSLGKVAIGITAVAIIYMLITAFGGTNTFWGWDARHSGWLWKVIMFIPIGAAAYLFYWLHTNEVMFKWTHGMLLFIFLSLGFAASTGFKFTGGDIKQRITYLDNLGKVKDTTVLFKYYDEFYHFSTDQALKNYVIKYGELPGRNNWNSYILNGEEPPSTAPRANENFQWHTGAYEMDLKKKLK